MLTVGTFNGVDITIMNIYAPNEDEPGILKVI